MDTCDKKAVGGTNHPSNWIDNQSESEMIRDGNHIFRETNSS